MTKMARERRDDDCRDLVLRPVTDPAGSQNTPRSDGQAEEEAGVHGKGDKGSY